MIRRYFTVRSNSLYQVLELWHNLLYVTNKGVWHHFKNLYSGFCQFKALQRGSHISSAYPETHNNPYKPIYPSTKPIVDNLDTKASMDTLLLGGFRIFCNYACTCMEVWCICFHKIFLNPALLACYCTDLAFWIS